MNVEHLVQAAQPELRNAIAGAGGQLPNLSGLANAALAKEHEEIIKSLTEQTTTILQSRTAMLSTSANQRIALEKSLAALKESEEKINTAHAFFVETNNLFPLRKLVGLPTPANVLARFPKIDEVPKDWVPATAEQPTA